MDTILLVGCGKMGGAMRAGWLEAGRRVAVVEPGPHAPAGAVGSPEALPDDLHPAAVVLAVKPQEAATVLPAYARFAGRAVFLSIMAGRTIAGMRALLGAEAAVVRAMPNTPAAVRQGITVACAGPGVTAAQRDLCTGLLEAIGEVAWVEDEALMDAVTAVSGSGPAYVFLLAEAMEAAGIAQGLPPELARRLARRTVAGSGALLAASAEDAADLRRNVTSPGGTTAAALAVLMAEHGIPALLRRAVAEAARRSRELAG
ncbi:pyrroline-5-carboxylate reductase [Elioraea sp.]|jgi:pyrroline-5-carboxylate reductase|uniref:pyrroline-5-carboxylate reductase n=1 Tax=Elioraea sp. TaxID=2185103 RepID=UPI0021DED866|nr:pyrroline-5-carboxylate reductase [Elioraea sp.]GIX11277.1 MAG: pyrroline-5-carboxylate reductase [Elioraea sp.]